MRVRLERLSVVALLLSAAYFALGVMWLGARHDAGIPANDTYALFYPSIAYAWGAIRQGAGLFWNPYQDCGQPFFAITELGLLYPVNLVFAVLDREPALLASIFLNLTIAGVGTFALCRALGLGAAAALCGALAFQLGGSTVQLAGWSPIHLAPYVWVPVAMWSTERVIQDPTARRGIVLGLALTAQLMPGFPQIAFFTYQLVALRMAWSLLAGDAQRPVRAVGCTAIGLALPLFLAAVQLLPALEGARESLRSLPLEPGAIGPGFSWEHLRDALRAGATYPGNVLVVVLAVLALFAPGRSAPGRPVVFYLSVAVLYFALSLGPGTPLYDVYARLPLGSAFRGAGRLQWVTNFALAVLAGCAAEAVFSSPPRRRAAGVAAVVVGAAVLQLLTPDGLRWSDWLLTMAVVAALIAPLAGGGRSFAGATVAVMVAAVLANALVFGLTPLFNLRAGDLYWNAAPAFAFVGERLTPQDRVLIVGRYGTFPDFSLMQKSASLYRVPGIFDYEPLVSQSYAQFFTYMRTGHTMRGLDDWYWVFDKVLVDGLQRPLFDLTGTRYLLVDRALDRTPQVLTSGVRLLGEEGYVRIYENQQALPRARYVPRIAVAAEDRVLPMLAEGAVDPQRVALVSRAPASGFLGTDATASGSAEVVVDAAERVVARVHAPAAGFLLLADQFFPGWSARVNGVQREIVRANYTFRLVEVPAGDSEVVFTYRPLSLRLGALISLATVGGLVVVWRKGAGTMQRSAGAVTPTGFRSRLIRVIARRPPA